MNTQTNSNSRLNDIYSNASCHLFIPSLFSRGISFLQITNKYKTIGELKEEYKRLGVKI